jgi:hypothetical protein
VAFFIAPAHCPTPRAMVVTLTGQLFDLLIDKGLHNKQTCLRSGLLYSLGYIEQHLAHRQNHLKGCLAVSRFDGYCLTCKFLHFSSGTIALALI